MSSVNPPLEPHPVAASWGECALVHSTRSGPDVSRGGRFPCQRRERTEQPAQAQQAATQAQSPPRCSQTSTRSVARLRHALWRGASDHTRDPTPGATRELPLARRYPTPPRGLVAVCPPRTNPTTHPSRLGPCPPGFPRPTLPRCSPGQHGRWRRVCGKRGYACPLPLPQPHLPAQACGHAPVAEVVAHAARRPPPLPARLLLPLPFFLPIAPVSSTRRARLSAVL